MNSLIQENGPTITEPESGSTRQLVHLVDHPIEVEELYKPYVSKHDIEIFDSEDKLIGHIKLRRGLKSDHPDSVRPKNAMIEEIILGDPYIGKGFGKAAYIELLKFLGDTPLLSGVLNHNSAKIWESLVHDGLAKEEHLDGYGQPDGYVSLPEAVKAKLVD